MSKPDPLSDIAASADRPDPGPEISDAGRLRSESDRHQRLRQLTVALSESSSATRGRATARFWPPSDANRLLAAARRSIWLHRRRTRELVLTACSGVEPSPTAVRIPADDPGAPAARGLRLQEPETAG